MNSSLLPLVGFSSLLLLHNFVKYLKPKLLKLGNEA